MPANDPLRGHRAEISLSILWLLTMEMRVAYAPTERPRPMILLGALSIWVIFHAFSIWIPHKQWPSIAHVLCPPRKQLVRFFPASSQAPQVSNLDMHRPILERKARPGGYGNPARCQSCGGLSGGAVESPVIKTIPVPFAEKAVHLPSSSFGDGVHGLFSSASG